MGRPRKSKEQHKIDGTWRKDRHNTIEYTNIKNIPPAPPYFTEGAKWIYDKNVRELIDKSILKGPFLEGLYTFCWAADQACVLQEKMSEMQSQDGWESQREFVTLHNQWVKTTATMRSFGNSFGFNPSDAGKIQIPEKKGQGTLGKLLEIKERLK